VKHPTEEPALPATGGGRRPQHPADDVCKYLRAKVSTAPHGDRRALWAMRDEASTVYWCLLTMRSAGPDDGLVHAERCCRGRACASCDDEGAVS
jgi:hypothetical protein